MAEYPKPKIELKNIKVLEGLSEETPCYTASLYVDGAKLADVSNAGHGGGDSVRPVKGITGGMLTSLGGRIADTYPKLDMSAYGMDPVPQDLETVCHQLVEDHRQLKHYRALLKRKLVFFMTPALPESKADAALYEIGLTPDGRKPENLARLVARSKEMGRYPLNLLDDAELLEALRRLS